MISAFLGSASFKRLLVDAVTWTTASLSILEKSISHGTEYYFFFFQAEDGIRGYNVTGVQTCALPISSPRPVSSGTAASVPSPSARTAPGVAACSAVWSKARVRSSAGPTTAISAGPASHASATARPAPPARGHRARAAGRDT